MSSSMDEYPTVVVDNGSGTIKAGFASYNAPKVVVPTITGKPKGKIPDYKVGMKGYETLLGNNAYDCRGVLNLTYPILRGVVTDWDDMEKLWHHTFNDQIRCLHGENDLIFTESMSSPKKDREKTTELAFEAFDVPAFFLCTSSVLSLYANGLVTGTVYDNGDGLAQTVPIYEGHTIPHASQCNDLAGSDVTNYLQSLLQHIFDKDYPFSRASGHYIVQEIKEKLGCVALDYGKSLLDKNEESYEMPDGTCIAVGSERFRCAEILFQPSLIDKGYNGVHEVLHTSIQRCATDIQNELYQNILLSGGGTMLQGFPERLQRELESKSSDHTKIKLIAPSDRKHCAWIGGSVLGSLSTFRDMCISKEEYKERGPSIVHLKCSNFNIKCCQRV